MTVIHDKMMTAISTLRRASPTVVVGVFAISRKNSALQSGIGSRDLPRTNIRSLEFGTEKYIYANDSS